MLSTYRRGRDVKVTMKNVYRYINYRFKAVNVVVAFSYFYCVVVVAE